MHAFLTVKKKPLTFVLNVEMKVVLKMPCNLHFIGFSKSKLPINKVRLTL